ncbi:glycoside hydrolase family 88/105 protein [Segatella bryantii]|jgi:rhamnogalacturonyl hydrolase YesR|uniref:glycoside hydrolase family 88/105 protein n=1 Tax=Segatella bryantii TaxID=77095 RepID=UPI001EDB6E27|nr:glycoside hydrolase family 88 protein [Segatella bryantii]MBQ3858283.1 glycoside hydrolase family 88 protein [Prevotella sp.]UKK75503.1 glycoside hydrolase family 88 protein [Segatella bryantii]
MKKTFILGLLALVATSSFAQNAQEVLATAQKANAYFMAKYADPTTPTFVKKIRPSNLWTRAVYYEGLMDLYSIDSNQKYIDYTDTWANFHKWGPRNGVKTTDADDQCCGQTYIDRYVQTGKKNKFMIENMIKNMDLQIASGRLNYWTWIDAIQMAMPLYAKMYKVTGDRKYMDYAMKAYRWSRNECGDGLFNTKTGLWYRDADYVPPYKEADGNDCYWSRGDGWVYAALVRVMKELDPKDPYYKELKKDFIAMSTGILKCQREDGFWNVSLVSPTTFGGKELTGTALFLYGMSWGIQKGFLKAKLYRPAADKAWNALEKDCVHTDGFLGWVQGTGKDPSAGQPLSYTKVPDFEDYGTGCFLLGATEYYKLLISSK